MRLRADGAARRRLLLVCALGLGLVWSGRAGAAPTPGFDQPLAAQVYIAALAFIAPRILTPIPVPQLTVWGLGGLSALDPRLRVDGSEGALTLMLGGQRLSAVAAPPSDDVAGWGAAAAALAGAAWPASPALQRAETQGVMRNFFDEMFNHLDPYSRYEPPGVAAEDRGRRSGNAGAGLGVIVRGGAVVADEVIQEGPAAEAGIRPGDRIVSVDGQSTRGKDAATVAGWIAGLEDTEVDIAWRGRDGRARSATLTRALVPPETVFSRREGNALIVQMSGFSRTTQAHLANEIEAGLIAPRPPEGLVLDLRGNRGGLLRQALESADLFLSPGVIAVTTGRDPAAGRIFRSSGPQVATDLPMVVLIDGRTASSAEILAAALQDRRRAVLVGSATLGKGLIQTIATLPDQGDLFVTWARVLTPLGWPIQSLGVLPQVCTSNGEAETLQQLDDLAAEQAPMATALARHDAIRGPVPAEQSVALRDVCPAAVGRDQDMLVAHWLVDHPNGYATALLPVQLQPVQPGAAAAAAAPAPGGAPAGIAPPAADPGDPGDPADAPRTP